MTSTNNVCYISILLLIMVTIGISISGCVNKQIDTQNDQISTKITSVSTNSNNTNSDNTNSSIHISKNVCEGCHMSGKASVPQAMSVKPHIDGGAYCMTCHNFSHDKHPIDNNVTCGKCHEGENPTKPTFINGSIVCNNCHNYPNPLQRSDGNLIVIHENRNVTCIICHAEKCTECHKEMGISERWGKRLNHFKVILDTLRYLVISDIMILH